MEKQRLVIIGSLAGALVLLFIAISILTITSEWHRSKKSIYPQLIAVNQADIMTDMVRTGFTRDVTIGYAIDKDESYDFIMERKLQEWDITAEELHEIAMRNLEELAVTTDIELATSEDSEAGTYAFIETGDGYDASRILSKTIRTEIAKHMGDEFRAGIPVRDFIIFWHKDAPFRDSFKTQIREEFHGGGKYQLTPEQFKVTVDGIEQLGISITPVF